MKRQLTIHIAGDVLTRPLARFEQALPEFEIRVKHGDIDQIHQLLARPAEGDVVILHSSSDFFFDEAAPGEPLRRMEAYCASLTEFAARESALIVINTLERGPTRLVGTRYLDDLDVYAALDAKIIDTARQAANVSVVDVGALVAEIGWARALSMQNRLAMRMPYTKAACDAICASYAQAIRERYVARKKVVVVDADNTLWGGVVGEDGVEGIAIDRQYPGAVYRRFQSQLLALRSTGVLLALVTKNNRDDIVEVFEQRDMPLALSHFSAVQINWEAKSDNIVRIAEELNLGPDSFIFIDDNPFELEQVRAALPMVEVYRVDAAKPDDALGLIGSIDGLRTWSVTSEDSEKAEQYQQERHRSHARASASSLEEYLDSIDISLVIGRNRQSQVTRISQLTNKTNQFNLTTRRYSETDIARLMASADVFDVRLIDRFGDMGVIGVVIVNDGEIDTFLMSCRALGRGVESRILAYICERFEGAALTARYRPTRKNMMTADFYEANGFEVIAQDEDGVKLYRLTGVPSPTHEIPVSEAV